MSESPQELATTPVTAGLVSLQSLDGIGIISPGDDLPSILVRALRAAAPADHDVLVVASKLVSRAEDRFVDLDQVSPGERAHETAAVTEHDPRLVELILQESTEVSRAAKGVLITRQRLGLVSANAAIDRSNAGRPDGTEGEWVLLLPTDPDRSAADIAAAVRKGLGVRIGVIISDSLGRPFRVGTVGAAIGVAAMPAVVDHRGQVDLHGRVLQHTITALADQVAAAADLVAGQGAEGRGAVLVRGVTWDRSTHEVSASELHRDPAVDLYA